MLEARAMPRMRAFENRESVGRFRSIGCKWDISDDLSDKLVSRLDLLG